MPSKHSLGHCQTRIFKIIRKALYTCLSHPQFTIWFLEEDVGLANCFERDVAPDKQ